MTESQKQILKNYSRLNHGKIVELCRRYPYLLQLEIEGLVAESWILFYDKADFDLSYNELITFWNHKLKGVLANFFRRRRTRKISYISQNKLENM